VTKHPKHAAADHDVMPLIRERWSPRAFDPNRDVSRDDLLRLLEAARWAPSSRNAQPWRFVVASRREAPVSFDALWRTLSGSNQSWAKAAPVLVLVAVDGGLSSPVAVYDVGGAMAYVTMQATSLDLSVRQMQGFDREQARAAVRAPANSDPIVIAAIGHPGDPATLDLDKHRAAETAPRERRPIAEFVYGGAWGEPY